MLNKKRLKSENGIQKQTFTRKWFFVGKIVKIVLNIKVRC